MVNEGLIVLISAMDHPIAVLLSMCARRSFSSSTLLIEFEIITRNVKDSPNRHIGDEVIVA